jgi:hypothetical protein
MRCSLQVAVQVVHLHKQVAVAEQVDFLLVGLMQQILAP